VRVVGQCLLAVAVGQRGVAAHLGGVGGEEEVRGRGRAVADAACCGRRGGGQGRRRLVGRLLLRGIQRSASGRAAHASMVDLLLRRGGVCRGRGRDGTAGLRARRDCWAVGTAGAGRDAERAMAERGSVNAYTANI
jgi:hypothetical protein